MATVPLAVTLLPLIPVLVDTIFRIVDAVKDDPATPEEEKTKLDLLAAQLEIVRARVEAAELPTPGSGA